MWILKWLFSCLNIDICCQSSKRLFHLHICLSIRHTVHTGVNTPQIIAFHYFCAPGVKCGVKWSKNLQGTQFSQFHPLIFSQNWIIFKNVQNMSKNVTSGKVFQSFFNYEWKTVAETQKTEFHIDFRFIWHPTWPQERESNGMKWFRGYLIQCAVCRAYYI